MSTLFIHVIMFFTLTIEMYGICKPKPTSPARQQMRFAVKVETLSSK